MANNASPTRTCVGCRERQAQSEMVRFVRGAQGWIADAPGIRRAPGRGAYLCSSACALRVAKNKRYPGLCASAAEHATLSASAQERIDDQQEE